MSRKYVALMFSGFLALCSLRYFIRGINSHDEEYALQLTMIGGIMGLWATYIFEHEDL